jgi:hypothetical protein
VAEYNMITNKQKFDEHVSIQAHKSIYTVSFILSNNQINYVQSINTKYMINPKSNVEMLQYFLFEMTGLSFFGYTLVEILDTIIWGEYGDQAS